MSVKDVTCRYPPACQGASSLPKTPSSLADSKYLQQTGESAFAESSNPSSSNTRSSDTVLAHLGVNQPTVQRHDMLFDSPAEVQDKKKRQAGYSRYWTRSEERRVGK